MSDYQERGLEVFGEVYGKEAADACAQFIDSGEGFGSECARWAMEFAFGAVWTRDGLERKMRSCVVLGMLIALRQTDEIKYHTRMGLANGLTKTELEEILYTSVPYAGLPASNVAREAMKAVLAELEA